MHRGVSMLQEDALLVDGKVHQRFDLAPTEVALAGGFVIALADGVAASPRSELVSQFVLEQLPGVLKSHPEWCQDGVMSSRHIREVHTRLCEATTRTPRMHGGATTLVAAHVINNRAAILNSGDSRAYVRRADGTVRQVTCDHTELERLRESGELDEGVDYASFYGSLSDCLVADSLESEFAIHRATISLARGDSLVLCTDGVHDVLGDANSLQRVARLLDPLPWVKEVRAEILAAGAPDNFSLIALIAA